MDIRTGALTVLLPYIIAKVLFGWRSKQVHRYRARLLKEVIQMYKSDLALGKPCEWRLEEFYSVGYTEMVFKFWKPVDSFYKKNPARKEK